MSSLRNGSFCWMVAVWVCLLYVPAQASDMLYEKENHPPKLEGVLARIHKHWSANKMALAKRTASQYGAGISSAEMVTVVLEPAFSKLSSTIDVAALAQMGVRVLAQSQHLMQVAVPVSQIENVAQVPGVSFVRLPLRPKHDSILSEGVGQIGAPVFHNGGYTGAGVKVGVIDIGFQGAQSLQAQGELPIAGSQDFSGDGLFTNSVHGSACAEIVHDIAPDAQIYLYKVSSGVDLENAKDAALRDGIDIVTVSLSWRGGGFGDGLGYICEMVNDAFANGLLWVNAAGNYGEKMYYGLMSDANSNGFHDFTTGTEVLPLLKVQRGQEIELWLTWNEWPLTNHDYDLLLYKFNTDGSILLVEKSDTNQRQTPPQEHLKYTVPDDSRYGVTVWKQSDAKFTGFKLISGNHPLEQGFASIRGSISIPGDAAGALTVGAINHRNWTTGPVEAFSSRGPTFDNRIKPDIVGPDGVLTISYGISGYPGTSAATPHVAGAAALLKSSNPIAYTAARLKLALIEAAIDMGVPGKDNVYGAGRLDIGSLLQGKPTVQLSREALDFGALLVGNSKSLFFSILNTGTVSLAVEDIRLPSGDHYRIDETAFQVAPSQSRIVNVVFQPRSVGDKSGVLSVTSNDPDRPGVAITLQGMGARVPPTPTPRLVLSLTRIEFETVDVGASATLNVRLDNHGDGALNIADISVSDDQFQAVPGSLSIPAKESRVVIIRFVPVKEGLIEAELKITSNDSQSPALSVPIIGRGNLPAATFSVTLEVDHPQQAGLYTVAPGENIAIEITGASLKDAVGFSALFEYDAGQVSFEGFRMGDVIPNAHSPGPYHRSNPTSVEVTAAAFGGTIESTEGQLGIVSFRTKATFQNAEIRMNLIQVRRDGKFEISKEPVVLKVLPNQGFADDGKVGFSLTPAEGSGEWIMDLNVTKGDQGVRELNGLEEGDTFTIELINNQRISPALGGSFTLSYDPSKVEPVTSAISGIASQLGAAFIKDGTVSFTLASLSGVTIEQGHVGQISFKALDGFDGETEIVLTNAAIGNSMTFENVASTPNNSVVIRSGRTSAEVPSPDFDEDGSVNFRDFVMFAQQFGSKEGDGMYKSTFDLDSNGEVGFRDFILFAQFYGKDPSTFVPPSS